MKIYTSEVAVAVVHNKLKPKKKSLPKTVHYYAGADVPDRWNCYIASKIIFVVPEAFLELG